MNAWIPYLVRKMDIHANRVTRMRREESGHAGGRLQFLLNQQTFRRGEWLYGKPGVAGSNPSRDQTSFIGE